MGTAYTFNGGVNTDLSNPLNYNPNGTPTHGDTVTQDGATPSSGTVTCDSWDAAGQSIAGGTFNCPVNLGGGAITGGTFNGVVDNSDLGDIEDGVFKQGIIFASSTTYGVNNRLTTILPVPVDF